MVKGSEVMQIVFSMKSRVEIRAIQYCMLDLVFFKVLSHTDTVRYASNDGSATAWHSVEGSTSNALSFGWPGPGQPDDFVRPV